MSVSTYPDYRESGLSWLSLVPSHWEIRPPKHFIEARGGGTLIKGQCASEEMSGLFPGFSASGQDVWLRDFDYQGSGLVLSAVGARCGKTFKADGLWGLVANTGCLLPRAGASRDFLWYLTNNEDWWEKGGTAQPFTRVSDTLNRNWAFPPLSEQSAIASFLDRETGKIDALMVEQERLIALLKEKRHAVISQAVTKGLDPNVPMKDSGVEWLGEVPAHWEVRSISSVTTKITNGYVGPTRDIFVEAGVRYLQSLHIKNNKIDFHTPYHVDSAWSDQHQKSILRLGDVLVVQTGDIGQAAAVTEEFAGCNCHALIILTPLEKTLFGPWLERDLTDPTRKFLPDTTRV